MHRARRTSIPTPHNLLVAQDREREAAAVGTAPPGLLLEREREVASLAGLIERVSAGGAGMALVEGPAGIGKSRLIEECRRRAAEVGLEVCSAQGRELEREYPFGVVRVTGGSVARIARGPARANHGGSV